MSYLYLTVLFPLIGFILLAAGRDKLSENVAAVIGVGSVGFCFFFLQKQYTIARTIKITVGSINPTTVIICKHTESLSHIFVHTNTCDHITTI